MFWHLLHYTMAGGEWGQIAKDKAFDAGWSHRQWIALELLALFLNFAIPLTIAFIVVYFFMS